MVTTGWMKWMMSLLTWSAGCIQSIFQSYFGIAMLGQGNAGASSASQCLMRKKKKRFCLDAKLAGSSNWSLLV